MIARVILGVGLGLVATSCATGVGAGLCLSPDEVFPEHPFELTVELSATQVSIGDRIQVTYHLVNASDQPVGACPSGWDSFHVISASKANRGLVTTSTAVALENVFRLPPHSILTWTREIEVPDVGLGDAQFLGKFESGCWLWSGQVWSRPVPIQIAAKRSHSG